MSNIAIKVENMSKLYRLGELHKQTHSLRDRLASYFRHSNKSREDEIIWALKDVSFEVRQGEAVGFIGRNGAGKSTLLKILSRITKPTKGRAWTYSRVGSLLEVGTGFHPELTGRENIFLNGAILGMKRSEIKKKFDEIVSFAEIERFIDTPVKRYSSGMYVRLAFAVAAHMDPDILLVDEVLAVGDAAFQKKCLGKMGKVTAQGRTILFVSHYMTMIQALCGRCLFIRSGQIVSDGLPSLVIPQYIGTDAQTGVADLGSISFERRNNRASLTSVRILNENKEIASSIPMGKSLDVEFSFEVYESGLSSPEFGIELRTALGQPVLWLVSHETYGALPPASKGGKVTLHIDHLDLMPGIYYITLGLSNRLEQLELIQDAIKLEITPYPVYPTGKLPPPRAQAIMFAPCSWTHEYQ
jgi:lipopolysaccharide transport system ATP-binding protein